MGEHLVNWVVHTKDFVREETRQCSRSSLLLHFTGENLVEEQMLQQPLQRRVVEKPRVSYVVYDAAKKLHSLRAGKFYFDITELEYAGESSFAVP